MLLHEKAPFNTISPSMCVMSTLPYAKKGIGFTKGRSQPTDTRWPSRELDAEEVRAW